VLVQKNQAKQKKFPEYEILKSKFVGTKVSFLTFSLEFFHIFTFQKK